MKCGIKECYNDRHPGYTYCYEHLKQKWKQREIERKKREYIRPPRKCICEACGKVFYHIKTIRKYCDECAAKRYIQVGSETYIPMKRNGKKIEEHRNIAKELGVLVNNNDVVHHLNGNKSDNTRSNLVVLSLSDHSKMHSHIREQLLKGSTKSLEVMSWEFINNNAIPHFHCSDNPDELEFWN